MCEAGSGVAVNGTSVTSVSSPAPVAAVTTFPVHQQQPSLIDPGLLTQYSGNMLIHSVTHLVNHLYRYRRTLPPLA